MCVNERALSVAFSRIGSRDSWNSERRPSNAADGNPVMCRAKREIVHMHREQCGLARGHPRRCNGCAECARPDDVRKVGIAARFHEVLHGDLGNRGGKVDLLEGFAIPCRFEEMVVEIARRLARRAFFLQQAQRNRAGGERSTHGSRGTNL